MFSTGETRVCLKPVIETPSSPVCNPWYVVGYTKYPCGDVNVYVNGNKVGMATIHAVMNKLPLEWKYDQPILGEIEVQVEACSTDPEVKCQSTFSDIVKYNVVLRAHEKAAASA